MKTFLDNAGRTWVIQIHVTAVKRVRALIDVDLFALIDDEMKGLAKLMADPCSLVDVIFVLCQDEAGKLGISDEDFGRAMAGDAIERGRDAFLAELIDFFPDPKVRGALQKVMEISKRIQQARLDRLDVMVDEIDVEAEVKKLMKSSTGLQVASESIPDPLRSAS
jgi:hypothetical protein